MNEEQPNEKMRPDACVSRRKTSGNYEKKLPIMKMDSKAMKRSNPKDENQFKTLYPTE
jgi:hypothetical protein